MFTLKFRRGVLSSSFKWWCLTQRLARDNDDFDWDDDRLLPATISKSQECLSQSFALSCFACRHSFIVLLFLTEIVA
jgi:hypothetical protein